MKPCPCRKNPSFEIVLEGDRPVVKSYEPDAEEMPLQRGAKGRFLPRANPHAASGRSGKKRKKARRNPPLSAYGPSYGYHGKEPPPESYLGDLIDSGRVQYQRYQNRYSDRGVPQMVTELSIPNSEVKLRYFDTPSPYYQPEFIISNPARTILRTKSAQQAASTFRQLVDREAARAVTARRFLGGAAVVTLLGIGWATMRGSRGA